MNMNFFTGIFKDFTDFLGTPTYKNIFEWLLPFLSIERLNEGVHIS